MRLPRNLPGADLAATLCRSWNHAVVHQRGSHIILETSDSTHHRISVPNHTTLRIGTLNGIYGILRSVAAHKGVTRDEVADTL